VKVSHTAKIYLSILTEDSPSSDCKYMAETILKFEIIKIAS